MAVDESVHETLIDRLDQANSDERREIVRQWTQEEIDNKRDIFDLFD